jgi:hypothetical protein
MKVRLKLLLTLVFALGINSCISPVKNDLEADNSRFVAKNFHKSSKIHPLNNIMYTNSDFIDPSYNAYLKERDSLGSVIEANDEYFKYMIANHYSPANRPKNHEVLPDQNLSYLDQLIRMTGSSYRDDRVDRINYTFFINDEKFIKAKNTNEDDIISTALTPRFFRYQQNHNKEYINSLQSPYILQ